MNPKQIEEFYHLSPIQKHLLAESESREKSPQSLIQFTCSLEGALDVAAFKRAWQKVTDRHPGLRMTYISSDLKEPVQVVNRNVSVDFEEQDWRSLSKSEQQQHYQNFLQTDKLSNFVLKTPPLWRVTLLRTAETHFWMVWTFHTILLDQSSVLMLINEVLAYYDAIHRAQNLHLLHPPSTRKYIDWLKKRNYAKAEQFWQKELENLHPQSIPLTGSLKLSITEQTLSMFQSLARENQLTLETVIQGAWTLWLNQEFNRSDVVMGINVSGRPKEISGIDRMIGHFANTLPLRIQVNPEQKVIDWLTALQQHKNELWAYEYFSEPQIQQWSGLPAELPLIPCEITMAQLPFETLINIESSNLSLLKAQFLQSSQYPANLIVSTEITDQFLNMLVGASPQESKLLQLVENILQHPDKKISALDSRTQLPPTPAPKPVKFSEPLVERFAENEEEQSDEQGWVTWIKAERGINDLIAEKVLQAPEAIAISIGRIKMTYRELNAHANQLARFLCKHGVAPQVPVGLYLEPSIELAIGLLGILKAGGAYLFLDPHRPIETSQQAIGEMAIPILLTKQNWAEKLLLPAVEPQSQNGFHNGVEAPQRLSFCLDRDWSVIAAESASQFCIEASSEHPACFIYPPATNGAILSRSYSELMKSLGQNPGWFQFDKDNPWCLNLLHPIEKAMSASTLFAWTPAAISPLYPGESVDQILDLDSPPNVKSESPWELEIIPESNELAPEQQWFFEQRLLEPQYWNISLMVEIAEKWEESQLRQVLQSLQEQHENLRLKFNSTENGWEPEIAAPSAEIPFEYLDLSTKWAKSQRKTIEETAARMQSRLRLTDGPLWRAVYFDLGARADRLLVIFHHLIGDKKSIHIFLNDLYAGYQQISRGENLSLPPESVSYQQWIERLSQLATDSEIGEELIYWWDIGQRASLPIDHPDKINTFGTEDKVFVSLNTQETTALLEQVPLAAEAELNEIILTALAVALARWAGENSAAIELEMDGRSNSLIDLDVSQTIGWFTYKFPVLLKTGHATNVAEALRIVQAQLRSIPNQGIGHSLLRYCGNAQAKKEMRKMSSPQVSFRFLENPAQKFWWQAAKEYIGIEHHPQNKRHIIISVTGAMNLGMLEFQWSYPREQFEQKNIGTLVNTFIEELQQLIAHYE